MRAEEDIIGILPLKIGTLLKERLLKEQIYEIRIKIGKPILVYSKYGENIVNYVPTKEDMRSLIQKISNYSLYAYEEDIRQGFITIKGGHRIGIAGECVMEKGEVKTIRNISSINIRVCSEVIGCSDKLIKYIYSQKENRIFNTIIISPPKCGKTTILRDIARNISNGMNSIGLYGRKVAVIDERSEIGACHFGIPQNDLGMRTDILDNCLKKEGMIMAIRSLSPEILICDEIGTKGDVEALLMAFNSGVNIITSIHGFTIEDLYKRKVFHELLDNGIIERAIVLSSRKGVGTIENIYELREGEKTCLS
ncbi:stage III sporulation protein AA [Clostridium butyricum]|uniref:Stage III sporulation protein AA n=1 Tax=Clostridium butyricum E4 str. BoNT E BL5262 TaxID=632245 RepID=C4IL68_CLOBU|nr:stage III sporulation protein AA [Clostridium butyricum]APF24628.1 stage III sporulation protein AA [Clostridium butyricum]EDT75678.1 stage III sporulation protein AA [Clostridium butyricum 5521]EEP54779.1 stage III sporulation protein AA [Clostridium butyricum E4 str. BoNT E BL5262]NFL30730.1 stage III sporulation protein AA [Clostridium butyricum]NFS18059.1 stage III sporulation protein AA [Clostridium butyricum]